MSQLPEISRSPLPPFTLETATQKVRMAEDGWNSRDPAARARLPFDQGNLGVSCKPHRGAPSGRSSLVQCVGFLGVGMDGNKIFSSDVAFTSAVEAVQAIKGSLVLIVAL